MTATIQTPSLRSFGLLPAEYEQIVARLDREPNRVELGMLGAMWSEHCSYKHSRKLLKLLPTSGPRVVQGPGENAGAVEIGDGLELLLKTESHNHPSAIEPFQGAATGVGGILRDIFTMGARPVAVLDSLRFGDPEDPRTEYLLGGVIGGIGHYGNCFGVPTVGGEISFDAGYSGNPIVNAMCVGIAPLGRLTRARAIGPGNPLLLVRAGSEQTIQRHFARWELHAEVVGHVTAEPLIRVREGQAVVAELPIALLTDDVPAYDLEPQPPPAEAPTPPLRADLDARP